jgi:putative tricarboxylic transport membrane protein
MKLEIRKTRDFWGGTGVCLFGIIAVHQTLRIPEAAQDSTLSPGFFPMLLAGSLIMLGLGIIVTGFSGQKPEIETSNPPKSNLRLLISILAAVAAYILLIEGLGFLLTTFLFMEFLLVSFKALPPIRTLPIAVAVDFFIWALFTQVFEVALPVGQIWGA